MRKIIHLTDPHVVPFGRHLIGLETGERFRACLDHIHLHHPDAALVAISGDLTEHGEVSEYERVRELLRSFRPPVRLMLGNHDDRANFRAAFPEAECDGSGFIQSTLHVGDDLFVFLDTKHGPTDGLLCPERLAWLSRELAAFKGERVLVFMHHPPTIAGVPHFATMKLGGAEDLSVLLTSDGRTAGIFCGHLHMPVSVRWASFNLTIGAGSSYRITLNTRGAEVEFASTPICYGVLLLTENEVIYHTEFVEG